MSEWAETLAHRLGEAEEVKSRVDDLEDAYMGETEFRAISDAQAALQTVITSTQKDIAAITEPDWSLVDEHATSIIQSIEQIMDLLVDAGLAEEDDGHGHWLTTVDDPPRQLDELVEYANRTVDDWHEVRSGAQEMLDEKQSLPRRHR